MIGRIKEPLPYKRICKQGLHCKETIYPKKLQILFNTLLLLGEIKTIRLLIVVDPSVQSEELCG